MTDSTDIVVVNAITDKPPAVLSAAEIEARLEALARDIEHQERVAIFKIAARLAEAHDLFSYRRDEGGFQGWVENRLGYSRSKAYRLVAIHNNLLKVSHAWDIFGTLPVRVLARLAAPSTPERVRAEILERLRTGEHLSCAAVDQVIDNTKRDPGLTEDTPQSAGDPLDDLALPDGENVDDADQHIVGETGDHGDAGHLGETGDHHHGAVGHGDAGHDHSGQACENHAGGNNKDDPVKRAKRVSDSAAPVQTNEVSAEESAEARKAMYAADEDPIPPPAPSDELLKYWQAATTEKRRAVLKHEGVDGLLELMKEDEDFRSELYDRVIGLQIALASLVAASKSSKKLLLKNLNGNLQWALGQDDPAADVPAVGVQFLKFIKTKLAVNKIDPKNICFAFVKH
jgi:hypothetical protein